MADNPDGKVVYEYVGDTSGIDKANEEAEKKIKSAAKESEESVKSSGDSIASHTKKSADSISSSAKNVGNDVKKSSDDTTKSVQSHLSDRLGGAAKAAGLAIGGAFTAASASAVAFGKKGIELASNLNEVQNVVDTTFGDNASKVNEFAQSAADNFGLSELQAKKYSSTLGAMVKSMGLSSDATTDMSTKLTGLAGDFASFYNLQPDEAFEKIRAGISGETEPLKELGINMSDANLQAFALSQGIKTKVSAMSSDQQAMLRYNYLMSVSKDAQGDFAKTSDSFANQQRILSMQFDSLAASVGQTLLPVLTEVMGYLTKTMSNPAVSNGLKDWFTQIVKIAQTALPPLIQAIQQVTPVLGNIVTSLLPPLLSIISQVLPVLVQLIQTVLPTIVSLISTLLPSIMQIVQQILPVLVELLNTLLPPLMEILQAVLPPLLDVINAILPPVLQLIQSILPVVIGLLKAIAPVIQILTPLISWLASVVGDNLSRVFNDIGPIINNVIGIFTSLLNFIRDVFTGNWSAAWQDVKDIFSNYFGALGGLVKLPVNMIINGLNSLINGLNHIKIPDWVPGVGGKGISIPLIPKLANGALAFGPTYAMIGDNPNASVDPEVVAPLSKLQSILSASIQQNGAITSITPTVVVKPNDIYLDGDKISSNTARHQFSDAAIKRVR